MPLDAGVRDQVRQVRQPLRDLEPDCLPIAGQLENPAFAPDPRPARRAVAQQSQPPQQRQLGVRQRGADPPVDGHRRAGFEPCGVPVALGVHPGEFEVQLGSQQR